MQLDGGIFARFLEQTFPPNQIDSWVLHDHLSPSSDDPFLRPSILRLVEKIIEPNDFKIKKLKLKYYRRNI